MSSLTAGGLHQGREPIDASTIAAATFLFYAILSIAAGGTRRTEDRLAVPAAR